MDVNLSIVRNIFLLFVALYAISCHPKKELTEVEKLAYVAKSWGLVKYYHSDIGTGKVNWDSVFIQHVELIRSATSNEEFNVELQKLLAVPSKTIPFNDSLNCRTNEVEKMVDFRWINADDISKENKQILRSILKGKDQYRNKYVSDSVKTRSLDYARFYEDPMENRDVKKVEIRLLGLFRYWNIIEYFFPYKNLIDKDWNEVLALYIPKVIDAENKEEYYKVLLELSTEINDGHASIPYHPALRASFFGKLTVPFRVKLLQNQLVVSSIKSDSLTKLSNIQIGDIITSIEKKPISKVTEELSKYIPKPNEAFQNAEMSRYILNGNSDSLQIRIQRKGVSSTRKVARYLFSEIRKHSNKKDIEPWKILGENIGYANMGELTNQNISDFFIAVNNTEGLILDFRYYPNWEILYEFLGHFYTELKPFVLLKSQCLEKPGTYYWHCLEPEMSEIELKKYKYNKPIKILVNENTLSFGEYFVMAMQVLENVEVVGSQTAGEDGNQVGIDMPGGIRMFMSSLGIYYPNGDDAQRVGIKIDQVIEETIEDIKLGNDRVLEFAVDKFK